MRCVKYKYFANLSWNKITNAGAIVLSKVCLGWSACFSGGLVWGDFVGRLFSALACTLPALKKDKTVFREVSVQRMLFLLKRYKECPIYVMPAQLLNTVGGYLPVFFLAAYFSKTELGYYSMTDAFNIASFGCLELQLGMFSVRELLLNTWKEDVVVIFTEGY